MDRRLSNEELAPTLRRVPFPFEGTVGAIGVEIYHGARGQNETHAPIRTFLRYQLEGKPDVVQVADPDAESILVLARPPENGSLVLFPRSKRWL